MPPLTSRMLPLGTPAPDFRLADPRGGTISLESARDARVLVIAFICNHCPFVKHIAAELERLDRAYAPRGVRLIAINSNDTEAYPADAPSRMIEEAAAHKWEFPYLFDETQSVAAAYGATCTPDFFVYGPHSGEGRPLAYRGCLDESRPGNDIPVTGDSLRSAIDAMLAGRSPSREQRPSIGCSIKWRPGNEPKEAEETTST